MKPSLQMTLLFLVVSYVVGHFFFRHPPKKPDGESARHIWRKHLREGKVHPCPDNPFLEEAYKGVEYEGFPFPLKLTCSRLMHNSPSAFRSTCPLMPPPATSSIYHRLLRWVWFPFCRLRKCPVEGKVEFPYLFLHEYLIQRDLNHLAGLVPWKGEDKDTHPNRSKLFLNSLKVRLQSVLPDWYQVLARNEAHVRLMSSTWYMARALRLCGLVLGVILGAFSAAVPRLGGLWPTGSSMDHLVFGAQSLAAGGAILFVAMWWAKRTIEHFLFYQRIREVTQVLETAYYAHIMDPNLRLFEGLDIDAPLRKNF